MRSLFLNTLQERGFIHQCTDINALDETLQQGVTAAYIGFDATADSLHVGSLLPIMLLRYLQNTGHKPIVLIGEGTTRIGDPTGKDASRKVLSDQQIQTNIVGIKKIFEQFLRFGQGKTDAILLNNRDWLENIKYIDFLGSVGRHFSVNRMLSFDSVKLRLSREQPLSFLEFNYMLLQAYDFMELYRSQNVVLQMGGSDQWGNIVSGVELCRRMVNKRVYGLTSPLLTTASGGKMGKSETGAVWLNGDKLSDFSYWQFWRNTEDGDVGRFLRLFTEIPVGEIEKLEVLQGAEINDAKIVLANEATKMCRGSQAAKIACETAQQTFAEGNVGQGLSTVQVSLTALDKGIGLLSLLTELGFTSSNSEARRQVQGGAVKINDVKIQDVNAMLDLKDIKDGCVKVSLGKKKHGLLKIL